MTLQTAWNYDSGETSEQRDYRWPDYRWPAHWAKNMADSIHDIVKDTLTQSRLLPQVANIQLAWKNDVVRIDKVLGSGAFSQVKSVICKDHRRYACKHLRRELMDRPEEFRMAASELACEAHMLAAFDHPNILKIRGWSYNGIASFEEGYHDSFFLLLDVLDETLETRVDRWRMQEFVSANDPTAYLQKLQTMTEIASALSYLHSRGVIFRDLKPNNIGFIGNKAQLFDFGLSRELPALNTSIPFEMSGKVGTLRYMANEVALNQPYNVSADVFSFAMVSYEMLSLTKPYDGWTRDMHTALVCERGLRPDTNNGVCPIPMEVSIILQLAWHADPGMRPSMDQIIAQLEVLKDQQHCIIESNQLEQQVAHHLKVQRSHEDAISQAVYIDMGHQLDPSSHEKLQRRDSRESIETVVTKSLSSDSMDI